MPIEEMPRKTGERKSVRVTIDADGRDHGKRYLITEMDALRAERWFMRVLAYLARVGISMPAMVSLTGMAALPGFNPTQMFAWVDDDSLMGEVMACIQAWPPNAPQARHLTWSVTGPDIEEPITLLRLKMEVFALHVGFSSAVALWSWAPGWAVAMSLPKPPELAGSTIQTSQEGSPSS